MEYTYWSVPAIHSSKGCYRVPTQRPAPCGLHVHVGGRKEKKSLKYF